MTKISPFPDTATPDQVGDLVNLSGRRVRQILAARSIKSVARGLVPVREAVAAIVEAARETREPDALASARARREIAKARLIELQTAEVEGKLIDLQEHIEIIDSITGLFITGLGSLPAQIVRNDLKERRRIETICYTIQNEIADAMKTVSDQWQKR